ncbi:MAG TPA: M28 family peptidase [Bellilinea sp.]|nr:M28 family peptidase [Bellilinea sp.]
MNATSGSPSIREEAPQLGEQARGYCRHLAESIGPRPAGSLAERAALDWLAHQARSLGFQVQWQEFEFAPQPAYLPYYALAAAGFWLAAALLPVFPYSSLLLPLLIAALPDLADRLHAWLPKRARSANLLVLPAQQALADMRLLLVAHVDSARAIPNESQFIRSLRPQLFSVMQRMAWIMILIAILDLTGLFAAAPLNEAAITLAVLTGAALLLFDLYDQLGARLAFVPGAGDNASGVASLLTVMQQTAGDPPPVAYLFSAAEETGMDGARAFAHAHRGQPSFPDVVSVDMVGAGSHLRIIEGTRSLRTLKTTARLNDLLERADPLARRHTALRRSGDFAPFLQAGLPATAIESNGTPAFWPSYHTRRDTLALVDANMLDHCVHTLLNLVRICAPHTSNPVPNSPPEQRQN